MPNHHFISYHFISYSSADALDFALKLANTLVIGPPSFPAWLDKRELHPGDDWDSQIAEAIKLCESMIFVMSRDSVEDESVCKQEWTRAFRYKKPVTPVLLHRDAELPFRFGARQFIDFTGDFAVGLARLQNHLSWLASPAGQVQALKDRLADAVRDQRRTSDAHELQRIADEIALLRQQIAAQEHAIANPAAAAQAVQARIETGLERERQPERPLSGAARTKFINPPPGSAPSYFQDRHVETRLLVTQLQDTNKRLITVVGRGGVGKTAMVCRLLKGIEAGRLPDELGKELGELAVDGLVYLSQNGTRQIGTANLFADLCKLLPVNTAQQLEALYRDPQLATAAKVKTLLTHFAHQRVLVLLDNLEDLIDPATRHLTDGELNELLLSLLRAPVHGVQVLCTTRIAPQGLALVQPQLQYTLTLDEGLDSPYAENILRAMDSDGKLGLQAAPAALLTTARVRTRGYPRALEALVAILSSDRSTTLPDLLGDDKTFLPDHVVETLVGEAYSRLDRTAQMVMQALAIYARPVTAAAIDFLLQPYLTAVDAAATLSRLVNMHFVRKEGDRHYLHPVDRDYALARVVEGAPGDGTRDDEIEPPFTRYALWHRGADYFAQAKLPRSAWKRLADLNAQLAEFDLRCTAQEYSTAADVLYEIDFNYLSLWGHTRLLVELHERLLGKLSDPEQKRVSLGNLGNAYYSLGQVGRAIDCYQQALAIAREIGNRQDEGVWLGNLGLTYADLGQVAHAIDHHQQALAIAKETGNRRSEGSQLGNLGLAYADLGQVERAIDHQQQALAIAKEIGDRRGEGNRLGALGSAYAALGQVERAIDHQQQALAIAKEIGDRQGQGGNLGNLGNRYAGLGQVERAIDYYQQAIAIAKEIGNRQGEGDLLGNLGVAYAALGQMTRAIDYYQQALAIYSEIDDRYGESLDYVNLGDLKLDQSSASEAISLYEQALQIADEIQNRQAQSESTYGLALAQLVAGNLTAAAQTIAVARQHDYPTNNANVLALQGVIHLRLGQPGVAQAAFGDAVAQANGLLAQTPQNYEALQTLGLAQAGVALCTDNGDAVRHAREAYRARARHHGVRRALWRAPCACSTRWPWRTRRACWPRCDRWWRGRSDTVPLS